MLDDPTGLAAFLKRLYSGPGSLLENLAARLIALEEDTAIRLAVIERHARQLGQLIKRSLHVEPTGYVSASGLVRLPDNLIQELGLQGGGGVSFILNKETGRHELWTTEQVAEWLGCK